MTATSITLAQIGQNNFSRGFEMDLFLRDSHAARCDP